MNSNVVAAYIGGTGRNQVLPFTVASGAETIFKIGTDSGSTTTAAVIAVPAQTFILGSQSPLDVTTNPALLNSGFNSISNPGNALVPFASQTFDSSRAFVVRLAGTAAAVSNAGNGFVASIRLGTTIGGTLLATNTASVANASTVAYSWFLEARLLWNSSSQRVVGLQSGFVDGTTGNATASSALTNPGTGITAVSGLTFVGTGTFQNAAGGTCTVSEFSITQI